MSGSYDYSLKKYPKITKIINKNNPKELLSLVNVHMENDGIYPIKIQNENELLLVNYITFNKYATNSYNVVLVKNNNNYSKYISNIPSVSEIKKNGVTYIPHYELLTVKDNLIIQHFQAACIKPATLSQIGSCSSGEVYEAHIYYKYKDSAFKVVKKKVAKKI